MRSALQQELIRSISVISREVFTYSAVMISMGTTASAGNSRELKAILLRALKVELDWLPC